MAICDPLPTCSGVENLVNQKVQHDGKFGQNICTEMWRSYSGAHVPTQAQFFNYTAEITEGEYITQFSYFTYGAGPYNFRTRATLSTEPLQLAPVFQAGGSAALTQADYESIVQAEANPALWTTYAADSGNVSLQLYAQKRLKADDMSLTPSVIVTLTVLESHAANLTDLRHICTLTGAATLPSGGTYLMVGADGECVNSGITTPLYANSYDFRASGDIGWDTDLYPAGGSYPGA